MKFFKGMLVGTAMSAGVVMAYNEARCNDKNKVIKKSKQFMRKMGII